jgi:hypothetical protein
MHSDTEGMDGYVPGFARWIVALLLFLLALDAAGAHLGLK